MSRTARLFRLMDALRARRLPVTAAQLAAQLSFSVRTVYRDIQTLAELGARIDGDAGVGYVLRAGFFLPPLMFGEDEIEALRARASSPRGANCAATSAISASTASPRRWPTAPAPGCRWTASITSSAGSPVSARSMRGNRRSRRIPDKQRAMGENDHAVANAVPHIPTACVADVSMPKLMAALYLAGMDPKTSP